MAAWARVSLAGCAFAFAVNAMAARGNVESIVATDSDRKVIGLFGDGSSMYSIQALWSAADLKLPMTIIIVNNGGYAALSEFLSHFDLKEPIGTEVRGIDFAGLARSLGCAGVRVEKPGELATTLRDALQSSVPILVDVAVG